MSKDKIHDTDCEKNDENDKVAEKLLEAAYNNDTSTIRTLIKNNEFLLRYTYAQVSKRILLIACSKNDINAETVRTLLDLNANQRDYTEGDGWETLHWAANSTDYDILKVLLERSPETINGVDMYDNNALHILIRYGDLESTVFQKCIELLLKKGIDVTQKNVKNMTSIDWAIKQKLNSDIIEIMKNQIGKNSPKNNEGRILLEYLKEGNEEKFINFKDGKIEEWVDYTEDSHTLLQMCCEQGLTQAAIHLLTIGANHEKTSRKNDSKPITLAAERGSKEIFKALLDQYAITKIPGEVLPTVVKYIDREFHDNIGCYEVFMEKMEKRKETEPDEVSYKLNEGDKNGNTALHYAVVYAEPAVIEKLLSLGASLGAKNNDGIMPIKNIEVEVLKNHLDKCVEINLDRRKIEKEKFTVKFNYRTLIPPYVQVHVKNRATANFNRDVEAAPGIQQTLTVQKKLVAETEVINFMSETSELKELLIHPTITSYLYLKWLKIQWIFWINLACYIIFASSFLIYIYIDLMTEKSNLYIITAKVLHIFISIGSLAIFFRELFQIIVAPKKYFTNVENYMELSLMVLSAMIALDMHPFNSKKELFALTILLIAFELVLLLGHHPTFSTNVVMFRTVSSNFYKFLLWYLLPIIAFAISFYLIFSVNNDNINNNLSNCTNTSNVTGSNEVSFALHPVQSVFKTVIMLTGEFNSGDLNFDTYPVTSKLIFIAFVFTIAIILLNLLNGLAVSDTQMIVNDAELVGYVARTQFITGIESMLMGDILIIKYAQKLIAKTNSLSISRDWNYRLGQYLLRLSCIFPDNFYYEVLFYPRQGELIIPTVNHRHTKCVRYSNVYLDHNTVQRTNSIIQDKIDKEKNNQNDSIQRIEYKQDLLTSKIDTLLTLIIGTIDNK